MSLSCKHWDCGSVEELDGLNVVYLQNRTSWGAEVVWKCAEGFVAVKEEMGKYICGSEGWEGEVPKCVKQSCGEAPKVYIILVNFV